MDSLPGIVIVVLTLLSAAVGLHNNFSVEFFHAVVNEARQANIIVSPSSAREALAQVYLGVEGEAATELRNVLNLRGSTKIEQLEEYRTLHHTKTSPGGGAVLEVGNRLYVNEDFSILPQYQQLSKDIFATTAERVHFSNGRSVADIINNWVKERTHNKISEVVDPKMFDAFTRLVIINTVYFKGTWKEAFPEGRTSERSFHMPGKSGKGIRTKEVTTMSTLASFSYSLYNEDLQAGILSLPYSNSNISMVIILPKTFEGLDFVERNLHKVDLRTILKDTNPSSLHVTLPKFKLELKVDLEKVLENIGIKQIFNGPDFSSLTDSREQLFVSKAFQKALIEVDEKGTVAAAVTVVIASNTNSILLTPIQQDSFEVDHPFIFAIKDEDHVYFIGRVTEL